MINFGFNFTFLIKVCYRKFFYGTLYNLYPKSSKLRESNIPKHSLLEKLKTNEKSKTGMKSLDNIETPRLL